MKIARGRLVPLTPISIRYDDTTGNVQETFDGGETWVDNPEQDPRQTTRYPPPDTADPRCDAAARMTAAIQAVVSSVTDGLTLGAGAGAIVQIIALGFVWTGFLALLWLLFVACANILAVAGVTDLNANFTSAFYDRLRCYLYGAIGADGRITDAGMIKLNADLQANENATINNVMGAFITLLGAGGFNDQAGLRAETGDCSACSDGWSHTFYADSPELNWWFPTAPVLYCNNTMLDFKKKGVTASDGAGHLLWLNEQNVTNGYILFVAGKIVLPPGSTLTAITWNSQQIVGSNLDGWHKFRTVNQYRQCWQQFYTGYNQWTGSIVGAQDVDWLIQWYNGAANGYQIRINSITISGTGVDPFV